MISSAVSVIREAENRRISMNSTYIEVKQYQTKTDDYGNSVIDYSKDPTLIEYGPVRIANIKASAEEKVDSETPASLVDKKYMLAKYDATWLEENMIFEYKNRVYRTNIVQDNVFYDEIISRSCLLEDITEI